MRKSLGAKLAGGFVGFFVLSSLASAIVINGYTADHNDRFVLGTYPPDPLHGVYPQPNPSSGFIGLGYDWSGVGWSTTNYNKSFALLGPRFFLYANHYTPAVGSTIDFTANNGTFHSYAVQSVSGPLITGSDLAIGMFSSPIPNTDNIHSYPILFLGYNTNSRTNPSPSPYYDAKYRNLLMYGWTARIGWNQFADIVQFSGDQGYYYDFPFDTTTPDRAKLVSGDSGSPTFITTSTPGEMYLAGDHYAVYTDGSGGLDSFLALELPQISAYMAQYGYLPYVVTPATTTWTGSTNNSWGKSSNWSGGSIPADVLTGGKVTTSASVLFDGAATTQHTINLNGFRTVTGVTFKSAPGSNSFTIATGSTGYLTIGEAGLTNNDDDVQTFTSNIVLRSPQRWNIGTGGLLVTGTIDTDTGDLLLIEGDGNATLSGQISNSGGLAKDGLGILTLNSTTNNSYSGQTFIHNGVLQIGNGTAAGSLGTGAVTDNATLAFNRSDIITVSNVISGSGNVQQIGSGTLILSGANGYSGTTTVTSGVLQIGNGTAAGSLGTGAVTDNATLAFNRSGIITVSNIINGLGNVQQIGSGTLILSGANGYSGTTTVTSGILRLANASALGAAPPAAIVQNSGTLDLNGLTIVNKPLTLSGAGSGDNGALVNNNTSSAASFNGPVTLANDATAGGPGSTTLDGSMNYGTFAFTKSGSGALTLTGPQLWGNNASATVQAGTLYYQQASGATTSVAAIAPTLHVAAGATANVNASYNDPFTDDTTSSQHVKVVTDATGSFNLTTGISSVAGISGGGATLVSAGATLYSPYIYQGQLTIGAGSKVIINPISGSGFPLGLLSGSSNITPIYSAAPIAPAAGMHDSALTPPSSGFGCLTLVPEPPTFLLLLLAGIIGLLRFVRFR